MEVYGETPVQQRGRRACSADVVSLRRAGWPAATCGPASVPNCWRNVLTPEGRTLLTWGIAAPPWSLELLQRRTVWRGHDARRQPAGGSRDTGMEMRRGLALPDDEVFRRAALPRIG